MNRLASSSVRSGALSLRTTPIGELIPLGMVTDQAVPSLRQELRATTQDVHDRLHRHVAFAAIQDGTVSLEDYRTLIIRLYGFYVPFEAAAAIEPDRSNWLAGDLEALDARRSLLAVPKCGNIPRLDGAHLRLGALYMAEGSTLGGRDLARGLDRLLGTGVADGRRFFLGRGAGTGEAWRGYLARLSAAAPEPSARAQIIKGAVETFDAFEHWLNGWSTHCMNDPGIPLASIDVTNCDREPIHIPGAILPHGVMLVLDANTLEVLQAAGDTSHLLGVPLESLLGRSAAVLFRPDQVDNLHRLVAAFDLKKPRHLLDPQLRVIADQPLDASLHRSGGSLVLEFEAADPGERFAADPLSGVQEMVRGFEEQPSLLALCQLAAERVREVARYDRVLVYRFMHDESGWVIAESREPHLAPFLDLHYPAADIPQQARALYVKNSLRLITQVDYDAAPWYPRPIPGRASRWT